MSETATGKSYDEAALVLSEEIKRNISQLSREPFRQALAEALQCRPTLEALQEFANKSPDRWAQAISILAKGSGYNEKIVHEHNYYAQIAVMSDSELHAQLQELETQLQDRLPGPALIEHDEIEDD